VASTVVTSLAVEKVDMPLIEPFGISRGTQDVARNALVTITLADGTVGIGEAAPLPSYNGETQELALEAIERVRALVEGADVASWRRIARDLLAAIPECGSARCAVETAILDALTRHAGISLAAWFGGAETALETDVTLPVGTAARAGEAAGTWRRQGFRALKIKVGADPIAGDVERVARAHQAAPDARILLDANGALDDQAALELVARIRERGIEITLFEQPVAKSDWEGLERIARTGIPLALDESVVDAADALAAAVRLGPPHVINVKPMKAGIVEAVAIAATARAAGMRLMIGGMVESVLAMTTSACLAAGLGGFAFVDLDTTLFIAKAPFEGGFEMRGPHIDLGSIRTGHGVRRVG
jgi:L-alanine-DL-glutamate epimerase-like enolase superfamily enzyme